MKWIFLVLCFFNEVIVLIVDVFVVNIGLIIMICFLVIFWGNLVKYFIVFNVLGFWYKLICLIFVVGIKFKILLVIFKLVFKIGMIVNFLLVNCLVVILVIGVLILIFWSFKFLVILYVINILILFISFLNFLVFVFIFLI